jgi:hypothetical protein
MRAVALLRYSDDIEQERKEEKLDAGSDNFRVRVKNAINNRRNARREDLN